MITLLHGPDDLIQAEHLATIRQSMGSADLLEANSTWLDGRKTRVTEVRYHCDVVPFLAERRLVVVEGLIAQLSKKSGGKKPGQAEKDSSIPASDSQLQSLLDYLPSLPDTTELVLIEPRGIDERRKPYKLLLQLQKQGQATIVSCKAPKPQELPAWINKRVKAKGATIDRDAAQDMAAFVGPNLRLLDSELEKLVAYRGGDGEITRQDVRLLVPYAQEANVFDMVDAIGQRNSAKALRLLRELERDGAAPLYLLSMIVRQFRILVQVSDQMSRGLGQYDIAKAIGLHPYPTEKAMRQVQQWRLADLKAVYDRLLETDLSIKTGKLADDLALDLLVLELSRRSLPLLQGAPRTGV
ncbi:MAG: DNA polymerase III subunit delta [Chloroflexota bacterium]|nr:DNA polymerase III subunit delta [Chloroflexota bacterium]